MAKKETSLFGGASTADNSTLQKKLSTDDFGHEDEGKAIMAAPRESSESLTAPVFQELLAPSRISEESAAPSNTASVSFDHDFTSSASLMPLADEEESIPVESKQNLVRFCVCGGFHDSLFLIGFF
jgi:hypothetical protein